MPFGRRRRRIILSSGGRKPPALSSVALWLDSFDFSSVTKDGGDLLAQLDNKVNNAVGDAVQGTGANQPLWTDNGMNNKDTVQYDGVNDYMTISGLNSVLSLANDFEIFVVIKNDTNITSTAETIFASTLSNNDRMIIQRNTNNHLVCGIYDGSYTTKTRYVGNTVANHVVNMSYASGVVEAYINEEELTETAETPAASTDQTTTIGARTFGDLNFTGQISEIIIYNRKLSAAERTQVNSYLEYKWDAGIPYRAGISGAIHWLKFNDSNTIVKSLIGEVSLVEDKSLNGYNGVQPTQVNQPILRLSQQGDQAALVFDGIDDYLTVSDLTLTHNMTFFAVYQNADQTSGGSVHRPFFASVSGPYNPASTGYGIGLRRDGADAFNVQIPSLSGNNLLISQSTNNEYKLGRVLNDNNNAALAIDGVIGDTEVSDRTNGFTPGYIIGRDLTFGSRLYKGGLCELLIYPFALTPQQILDVEAEITAEFKLDTLPIWGTESGGAWLTDDNKLWEIN